MVSNHYYHQQDKWLEEKFGGKKAVNVALKNIYKAV